MKEDNSKLLEIFHLTWPNLTRKTKVIDKMKQILCNEKQPDEKKDE
jgi:hypothetical protein